MSPDRTPSLPARFARDDRGAIMILWALFLAVAFGFLALAFDLGRLATTQTQLQSFADQVALAAAGELDGRPGARVRATAAAQNLVAGQQTFGQGSQSLGNADFDIIFLSSLPASDTLPATAVATSDASARYVRVVVDQRTVLTPFAHVAATLTGNSRISADVGAEATAGFTSYACDVTPLFFCVPDANWRASDNIGTQVRLVAGSSGNGAWTPGNFGFLDPKVLDVDPTGPCANQTGASLYKCLVGAERGITTCIETSRPLETMTGQAVGLTRAFNTRFDVYHGESGGPNSFQQLTAYRPAPNVVQGRLRGNDGCYGNNPPPATQTVPLPRDSCIANNPNCRFGNGDWSRTSYVATNHGGVWPPGTGPTSTRFQMYLAEIAGAQNGVPLPGKDDTGEAVCHAAGPSDDVRRRNVIAAAVACGNQPMNGKSNVAALEYVELFLTEPVEGANSDSRLLAEIVGTAGGIGSGALEASYRDFIQLYR